MHCVKHSKKKRFNYIEIRVLSVVILLRSIRLSDEVRLKNSAETAIYTNRDGTCGTKTRIMRFFLAKKPFQFCNDPIRVAVIISFNYRSNNLSVLRARVHRKFIQRGLERGFERKKTE